MTEHRSFPKGVKARTGKGKPTMYEARWMGAIVDHGCVACRRVDYLTLSGPAEVHHILRGGRQLGHLFTLPLCEFHHRGDSPNARHPWRKRFEAQYGTELDQLAKLKETLGFFDKWGHL